MIWVVSFRGPGPGGVPGVGEGYGAMGFVRPTLMGLISPFGFGGTAVGIVGGSFD